MIGRSVLLVLGSGVAFGSVVLTLFGFGERLWGTAWALVPGGIGAVVALYEWVRIRRTPIDGERPGIVAGDE